MYVRLIEKLDLRFREYRFQSILIAVSGNRIIHGKGTTLYNKHMLHTHDGVVLLVFLVAFFVRLSFDVVQNHIYIEIFLLCKFFLFNKTYALAGEYALNNICHIKAYRVCDGDEEKMR
jgi:hypothetical protein